jgi:hypothetical protein
MERISLSQEMVAFENLAVKAKPQKAELENLRCRQRSLCRSAMHFLQFIKNQDQHAALLKQRDSQTMEQCKSFQRRFISGLRQRHNGKFSSESASSTTFKIRAPPLLLK